MCVALWYTVLTADESNVVTELQDETGGEVIIGVSLMGVLVCYENNQTSKFYRWVKSFSNLMCVTKQVRTAVMCLTWVRRYLIHILLRVLNIMWFSWFSLIFVFECLNVPFNRPKPLPSSSFMIYLHILSSCLNQSE
jgi:hypothetical protein